MNDWNESSGGSSGARVALALSALFTLVGTGCTDATLYSPTRAKAQADRVALEGRVCTEDPVQSRFPVRVILLADRASGPLFSDYDPGASRVDVLREFVRSTLSIPKTSVSVIGYGSRPRKLAPKEGEFTRNPGALFGALNQLSISRPCVEENRCRNYREALRTAQSLVEGDAASLTAGTRSLTQHFVLMVNGGPQRPLIDPRECCAPDDAECRDRAENASGGELEQIAHECETQRDAEIVTEMKDAIRESGGAGLQFHSIHLAAHEGNVEGGAEIDERVEEAMKAMAFAGGGTYQRFGAVGGLSEQTFDVLGFRTVLHAKLLMAANRNVVPGPEGPRLDSDADGLPDKREAEIGTDPTERDSDDDGITDRVELLVDFDPTQPDDPKACADVDSSADPDLDRLTNCDERLLGTEPTLVDTDGDAMPDSFEVFGGTDYLTRDADADEDGDGVDNGEEIRRRTDPRSTDIDAHQSFGYRYEVRNEGFVTDLFASQPEQVTGVEIVELSEGTTAGVGTLKYTAGSRHLQWRDAGDDQFGTPVAIEEASDEGNLTLPSGSFAPVQQEEGKRVVVEVTPEALPPRNTTESIRITARRRQCLEYTIRNVKLMATEDLGAGAPAGTNDIVLYFAESPGGDLRRPGPYRRAQIPVRFDPPDARQPDDAVLQVENREFVRPEITIATDE